MANKDVKLVISAKNEATKAIDSVAAALKVLSGAQDDVGQSAKKADGMLGELGAEFKNLGREVASLAALKTAADAIDRASAAVERLEKASGAASADLQKLSQDSQAAKDKTAALTAEAEALTKAYEGQAAALRQSKKEQTAANSELTKAESLQSRLSEKIQRHKPQGAFTNAAESAGVFASGFVEDARSDAERAAGSYRNLSSATQGTSAALKDLGAKVRAAAAEEARLASETDKAAVAANASKTALAGAQAELTGIQNLAQGAASALGGISVNQNELKVASDKASEALKRTGDVLAAMQRYSTGTGFADPKTAAAMQAQRVEMERVEGTWKTLQIQARNLALEIAKTEAPTKAQTQALNQVVSAARAAKQEFATLQASFAKFGGSARGSFSALNDVDGGLKKIRVAANDTADGGSVLGRVFNNLRGAFSGVGGDGRQALSVFQRMRGEVLSLATAYLGLYNAIGQVGGVITAYQKLEAAQNRLGVVFGGNQNAVRSELQFLERQAARLGIEFGTLSDEYAKFAVAANAANFSSDNTRKIFLSVAEAGRVNKLSIDQLQGVFLALQQMISKGKVQSEELRRQLGDRLAGAFNIFADALGLTAAQLDAMMQKGEVLADETNLLKFADELDRRFGPQLAESLKTTTTLIGQFFNEIFQAQLRVGEGGFISALNKALAEMIVYFRSREGRDFFLSIGSVLGTVTNVVALFVKNIDLVTIAFKSFVALKVAQWLVGLIGPIAGVQGGLMGLQRISLASMFTTAAGAATNLAATLALLRNAATALGAVFMRFLPTLALTAAGYLIGTVLTQWAGGVDSATSALDQHKQLMTEVLTKYDEAKGSVDQWAAKLKTLSVDQINANVRRLRAEFEALKKQADEVGAGGFLDNVSVSFSKERADLAALRAEFNRGKISAGDYEKGLNQLYKATDSDSVRKYIENLLEVVRKAKAVQVGLGEAAVAALEVNSNLDGLAENTAVLGKNADGSAKSVKDLAEAGTAVDQSLGKNAKPLEGLQEAMDDLKGKVPSLVEDMRELKQITDLNASAMKAFAAAVASGDFSKVSEALNLYRQGSSEITQNKAVSGNLVDIITGVESGGNANAKNPKSTATGLGQFIEDTWLRMFKQYFPDRAAGLTNAMILELRKDATVSREMVGLYLKENAKLLSDAGLAVNNASLYLSHFLGPGGAIKVLNAAPNTPTSDVLGQDQISANASILQGKTTAQVIAWAEKKVGISSQQLKIEQDLTAEENKRLENSQKAGEATTKTIADNEFEIEQQRRKNEGKEREAAIEEAVRKAREQNKDISEEQLEIIKRQAAQQFDLSKQLSAEKEQKKATEEAQKRINDLESERNSLMEIRKAYEEQGNNEKVLETDAALKGVNEKLREATENAIRLWQGIGGPEADAAIAKLQAATIKIQESGQKAIITKGQFAGMLADGITNAFGNFFQALGQGEKAIKALGNAFRQFAADFLMEIAKMILKQLILNALQSVGFGGGGSLIPGVLHGGGIAGSSNRSRAVNPAWFSNATRYHSGGVAGLAANEVPAVLEVGEEVLADNDPRHRANLGKAGGDGAGGSDGGIAIINAIDAPAFITEALNSVKGRKNVLNFMSNNSNEVKQALGIK